MATVNIALMFQIRANLKLLGARNTYSFKREKYNLAIILFFFELSYGLRFIWDKFIEENFAYDSFKYCISFDIICYVDALSLTALLLFHNKNFKEQRVPDEPPVICFSQYSSSVNEEAILQFTKSSRSVSAVSSINNDQIKQENSDTFLI